MRQLLSARGDHWRGLIPEGHEGVGEVERYLAEQEDEEKPGRIRARGSGRHA